MKYQSYQTFADMGEPARLFAAAARQLSLLWMNEHNAQPLNHAAAWFEQIALLSFTHARPAYAIDPVPDAQGRPVAIHEGVSHSTPFCDLVRFRKDNNEVLPKVLLVAPMSGHFATLLRGTVQTLVQDHEVYLTDWLNIRDIPLGFGEFGLDEYIEHLILFMQHLGPDVHLIGVCQPTVACLAAAAVMAEARDPCQPATITLMAGPIDARVSPTKVNELAMTKPIDWFEKNMISVVPLKFEGFGRKVYPGFMQLTAFMSMNPERHQNAFKDLYTHRVKGEDEQATAIRTFYEEYFAIMDLSAPFYLQTVEHVFQKFLLPQGLLTFRGQPVRLEAIRKPFLLTVEGERDDICGIGQTMSALDLCTLLPAYKKTHHLQPGVGHYGVFAGRRWASRIYPVVRNMIQTSQ